MLALAFGALTFAAGMMGPEYQEPGSETRSLMYEKMDTRSMGMSESVSRAINLQDDRFAFVPFNPPDMSATNVNQVLDNHATNNVEFMQWTSNYFMRPRMGRIAQQNSAHVPQLVETLTENGRIGVKGDHSLNAYPYTTFRRSQGYKRGPVATVNGTSSENMPRGLRQADNNPIVARRTPFGPSGFVTYATLEEPKSKKKVPVVMHLTTAQNKRGIQLKRN